MTVVAKVGKKKFYITMYNNKAAKQFIKRLQIQIFENSGALDFGAEMIAYGDALIYMYNKERMLVEVL